MIKDQAAIVGIGETGFSRELPHGQLQLACMAILAALDEAGIDPAEVDGLCSFTTEKNDIVDALEVDVARNLGLGDLRFWAQVGYGGGAPCATVGLAAMAIATKQASVVVAWRARKRGKAFRPWGATSPEVSGHRQFSRPWGLVRPVDEIAMFARRYMHEYGATREQLANVALAQRKHANRNPRAIMYEVPLTLEQYFSARSISEPLCLFDNCLENDGAVATVLVSADRARDLPQPPAYVHAFGQGLPRQHQTMMSYHGTDPLEGPTWACARALWRYSDFKPEDVRVAQIYDAFTPEIWLSLEGFGFCKRGEGADFTNDGNLEWDRGRLALNTSGGSLSEAYVHGFNLISEGVRQIRATSTAQVDGAEVCLVTSSEEVPTSAILLRR